MPPKTNVYLSKNLQERVAASGKRVAELVELGLAVAGEDGPPTGSQAPVTASDCKHPPARRDRKSGLCNACGTNLSTS